MIKDTDEQPDEEMQGKVWDGPKPRSFCSCGSGVRHPPDVNLFTNLEAVYGEGNGTPLQYSCLENPMDGGDWWAVVHGVATSWT